MLQSVSASQTNTDKELANLEKEIYEIQEKINKDAPPSAYRGAGGYGHCF